MALAQVIAHKIYHQKSAATVIQNINLEEEEEEFDSSKYL